MIITKSTELDSMRVMYGWSERENAAHMLFCIFSLIHNRKFSVGLASSIMLVRQEPSESMG